MAKQVMRISDLVSQMDQGEMFELVLSELSELVEFEDENNNLVFVNSASCRFFGKTKEELTGSQSLPRFEKADQQRIPNYIDSLVKQKKENGSMDTRLTRCDGQKRWINWTGRLLYNGESAYIGYLSIGRDVTERKKLEMTLQKRKEELEKQVEQRTKELETSNSRLQRLNDTINDIYMNIPAGVLVADADGNITNLNHYLRDIWGRELPLIMESLGCLIRRGANPHLKKLFTEERVFHDIEVILSSEGGGVPCLVSGVLHAVTKGLVPSAVLILEPLQRTRRIINSLGGNVASYTFRDIQTNDPVMLQAVERAKLAAKTDGNVMIMGESGTGKEMLAQAIHNAGSRRRQPFIAINCGAIPRDLVGSELFGYVEGAFTGAKKEGRPGKFELASGGTLFLDEIGDMPIEQQVALLRAVQEKAVTRIGSSNLIKMDVRIICATNKDLRKQIDLGAFREDLFYRLNLFSIQIPPLRQRLKDIPDLIEYFRKRFVQEQGQTPPPIPDEILRLMRLYPWPGNARELQNVVELLLYVSLDKALTPEHLPEEIRMPAEGHCIPESDALAGLVHKVRNEKAERENRQILELVEKHNGNLSAVARALNISRTTLYARIGKIKTIERTYAAYNQQFNKSGI